MFTSQLTKASASFHDNFYVTLLDLAHDVGVAADILGIWPKGTQEPWRCTTQIHPSRKDSHPKRKEHSQGTVSGRLLLHGLFEM